MKRETVRTQQEKEREGKAPKVVCLFVLDVAHFKGSVAVTVTHKKLYSNLMLITTELLLILLERPEGNPR